MENENRKNRIKIAFIILLMSISLGALSYSFGWVSTNPRGVTSNFFSISEIDFGLKSNVSNVSLGEVLPTLDKFGVMNEAFTFTITNVTDLSQNYIVKLIDGEKYSTITNENIRYQLMIDGEEKGIYNLSNTGIIDSGKIESNISHEYSIKIWLDYNSNQTDGIWEKIVFVDAGDNNLDTSGANAPTLSDGMIPVYYDENIEAWRKADKNNEDRNHQWYDYDSLMWANVVTVSEKTRKLYTNASLGTEVKMEDINSFWVWIPRFKYTIFDSKTPKMINIAFENGIKSTGSVSCVEGENVCNDNLNGSIKNDVSTYTHPAFTFLDTQLEGIWVSKFEAGEINDNIYIKPNIESIGNVTMDDLLIRFNNMTSENNIYGFVESENDLDIHMIKNREWGAVSYLYHSKYGKFNNSNYTTKDKEIYHNDSLMTGYSTGSVNKNGNYQYNVNKLGTGASTTGNIYGVYDMKGGKGEMIVTDSFDNFKTLGSALNETNWYDDKQVVEENKVLYRGGIISSYNDGIFGINIMSDNKSINIGSRPVLIAESNVYVTNW